MSINPKRVNQIKEHIAVMRTAAETSSSTLAKLQEVMRDFNDITKENMSSISAAVEESSKTLVKLQTTLHGFNEVTTKQSRNMLWLTILIIIVSACSAGAAISSFNLANNINSPSVSVSFNENNDNFVLKNYGRLPAKNVHLLWKQLAFGEGEVMGGLQRSEIDYIYGNDIVVIPRTKTTTSRASRFLIFVWSDGTKNEVRKRVFLNEPPPSRTGWVLTTKNMVDATQWSILDQNMTEMENKLIKH